MMEERKHAPRAPGEALRREVASDGGVPHLSDRPDRVPPAAATPGLSETPVAAQPVGGDLAPACETAPGGRLFVVATPIGNLRDVTLRALDTLRQVRLIAAEDTRQTRKLLSHYDIHTPLISYHQHNRARRLPQLLEALREGDVALVSDAGTPLISDPGQELVAAAVAAGHRVVPIPGPSAPIAALSVAGVAASPVTFAGFLPRRATERRAQIAWLATLPGAIVLFEAPHRLRETLAELASALGDRPVAVCGELTKLFEQVLHTTLAEAARYFERTEPRGEFTLVIGPGQPAPRGAPGQEPASGEEAGAPTGYGRDLHARFLALERELGSRGKALARLAAETGRPRKTLYRELLVPGKRDPT